MEKQPDTKQLFQPEEAKRQTLSNKSRLLEAILDNIDTFIYVKDSQGRYKYINRKYHNLLHFPDNEWKGKTDHDFMDGGAAEKIRRHEHEVLRSGMPNSFEEVITIDGIQRQFISYKVPLSNKYGFGEWVCSFATEITDFKKELPVLEGYKLPA